MMYASYDIDEIKTSSTTVFSQVDFPAGNVKKLSVWNTSLT
jgi:hypothetical protein